MDMEVGGKKILIIGGHELTALKIAEIRRVCEYAKLEFRNVIEAMDRMAMVSIEEIKSVKDLIELASKPIRNPSLIPNCLNISRNMKDQHKRAMRYHGRR